MILDALLHRYGGNLSFLNDWTWDEAVSFIDCVMERIADEERRLRWYIRYEEQFPKFADFRKAVTPSPAPVRSIGDIYADAEKLMDMTWKEVSDGERN